MNLKEQFKKPNVSNDNESSVSSSHPFAAENKQKKSLNSLGKVK